MKYSISASLIGALAMGVTAYGQTTFNSAFDSDIVDGGSTTYNVTGPVTIGVNAEVVIDRPVYVTEGGSLTIQEGAIIRFQPNASGFNAGFLCISADGTISAIGTATNPIIMTTAAETDGSRWDGGSFMDPTPKTDPMDITSDAQVNLWGGLIVLGNAPTNVGAIDDPDGSVAARPGVAKIEGVGTENGLRAYYGGFDPNDSSGTLRYISIRYSGQVEAEGDEIQGLTLGGVGYGTEIDYIEVFGSGDDGIEIFGGTASLKHLCLSYFDDDGFDGDHGWTGNAQFGLVVASNASFNSDNLFELDGDDDISDDDFNVSDDGRPFAYPTIANFTAIGHSTQAGRGMRLRQGFGGNILNTIVANVPNDGLRIDDSGTGNAELFGYPSASSADRVAAGTLNLASVSFYGVDNGTAAGIGNGTVDVAVLENNTASAPGASNNVIGALTGAAFGNNGAFGGVSGTAPFNPVPFNTAVSQNIAAYGDTFFDAVTFRGAFARIPTQRLWTTGWTALNTSGFLVDNGINSDL